jgi:uncharacterized protein
VNDVLQKVVAALLQFDPDRIILFGSRAGEGWDRYSDIDLIVVYRTKKRFLDRLKELYLAVGLETGAAVDILAYTPEEFDRLVLERPFVQDAVAQGVVVYEKSEGRGRKVVSGS